MAYSELHEVDISDALLSAPGWARVGLTMPDARMRENAATELAKAVIGHLNGSAGSADDGQLVLAF